MRENLDFQGFTGSEPSDTLQISWRNYLARGVATFKSPPDPSRPMSFERGSVVATGAQFQIGMRTPAEGLRETAAQ